MRKAFLTPPVVLGLCVGLCGCGGSNPMPRGRAENLADVEDHFQTSAETPEHRASARQAAREFIETRFGKECKIYGLHSSLTEGGIYLIAADVGIGQRREIVKLEAIRFFPEEEGAAPYWDVTLLSATSERVTGDPVIIKRLKTPDTPKAEPTPDAPAAPAAAEPTPAATAPP